MHILHAHMAIVISFINVLPSAVTQVTTIALPQDLLLSYFSLACPSQRLSMQWTASEHHATVKVSLHNCKITTFTLMRLRGCAVECFGSKWFGSYFSLVRAFLHRLFKAFHQQAHQWMLRRLVLWQCSAKFLLMQPLIWSASDIN